MTMSQTKGCSLKRLPYRTATRSDFHFFQPLMRLLFEKQPPTITNNSSEVAYGRKACRESQAGFFHAP
ncbi:hypothetical protein BHT94_16310 [Bacillus licheniformis]|nr:hypothetical protein BHT94_16310 [Bacillus licheniformis]